jgi:ketosteroid isomerase-like protein
MRRAVGILLVAAGVLAASAAPAAGAAPAASAAPAAGAAPAASTAPTPAPILPDTLRWASPPHTLGLAGAWVRGGETETGPYILRVKLAAGARIAPHSHPDERTTTVLAGTLFLAFGDAVDDAKLVAVPAGAVVVVPAGAVHQVLAREGAVMYQESGIGPTATRFETTGANDEPGVSTSAAALADEVRAAETAFAATMAARDHGRFTAFVADEALFFGRQGVLRGKDAVAAGWEPFFAGEKAPFSWAPEIVEVLDSGMLALSSGPVRAPDGKQIATFNSIWRREADGRWRVVFDKGCPVCADPSRQ